MTTEKDEIMRQASKPLKNLLTPAVTKPDTTTLFRRRFKAISLTSNVMYWRPTNEVCV